MIYQHHGVNKYPHYPSPQALGDPLPGLAFLARGQFIAAKCGASRAISVTREPNDAISWMQRFTTKFLAEPNADLLTGSQSPITFKSMSVFEDEVVAWLNGNDEPENFKHW